MALNLSEEALDKCRALPSLLLPWFDRNARYMPWREAKIPYYTWISEIMLQQTRVEAATDYFLRFVKEVPDIPSLAELPDEQLMKLWEGLGYYNRARNLKEAAKIICRDYDGELPADFDALLSLPGIGNYTAGAISSIAFELPYPAVDGNVLRVASRVTESHADITEAANKKEWEAVITSILPEKRIGDFNQSLMEIGALVCVPNGAPHCMECPLAEICDGFKHQTAMELPVKPEKKKRKIEKKQLFLLRCEEEVAIHKRDESGLLASLWEFPNVSSKKEASAFRKRILTSSDILEERSLEDAKHIFSHVEWHMQGTELILSEKPEDETLVWIRPEELETAYSIPSAFKTYRDYIRKTGKED